MKIFRFALLVPVLTALFLTGCAAFQTGDQPSDTVATTYSFGTLTTSVVVQFDRAWPLVQLAIRDLNYKVIDKEKDLLQATLNAEGEGKQIRIKLEQTSSTSTEIRIRIGKVGDKEFSYRLLKELQKHL